MLRPEISVVVPIHRMANGDRFLWRLVQSLMAQTFQNYELVITQAGKMAENTNAGINKARGEIIKILYMDDYFAHPNALDNIHAAFDNDDVYWMATGCVHQTGFDGALINPHVPKYNHDIHTGNNTIGSPSVVAFVNETPSLFDETLSYLLDCDLYKRLHQRYGDPHCLDSPDVVIGIGDHQTTHLMPSEEKLQEFIYLKKKYA